jgi:hypothetical protein
MLYIHTYMYDITATDVSVLDVSAPNVSKLAAMISWHVNETRTKLDINTPQTSSHKFGTSSLRYQGSKLNNELPDLIKGNKVTKATCGDIKITF